MLPYFPPFFSMLAVQTGGEPLLPYDFNFVMYSCQVCLDMHSLARSDLFVDLL